MEDEEFYVPLAKRGSRFENSLGLLTRRFRGLVDRSDTAVVDLNEAADVLGVRKRRIYDITNVLEGVGMIKKTSKNTVTFQYVLSASRARLFETNTSFFRQARVLEVRNWYWNI